MPSQAFIAMKERAIRAEARVKKLRADNQLEREMRGLREDVRYSVRLMQNLVMILRGDPRFIEERLESVSKGERPYNNGHL